MNSFDYVLKCLIVAVMLVTFAGCEQREGFSSAKNALKETAGHSGSENAPVDFVGEEACGANCAYVVARCCGVVVSYQDVYRKIPPSKSGISFLQIKDALTEFGLRCQARKLTAAAVLELSNPAIVYLPPVKGQIGHYIVTLPVLQKGEVWIVDPPSKRRVPIAEFQEKLARQELEGLSDSKVELVVLEVWRARND